jgi:hypothetical protein
MSLLGVFNSSAKPEINRAHPLPIPTAPEDSVAQVAVRVGSLTISPKTIDEVLVQKEIELTRVGKELDALRIVAPLLRDEKELPGKAVEPTRLR